MNLQQLRFAHKTYLIIGILSTNIRLTSRADLVIILSWKAVRASV